MIKKLRIKFIITNMVLVSIVLMATFSVLYISTANKLEKNSIRELEGLLRWQKSIISIERALPKLPFSAFIVTIDHENNIFKTEIMGENISNDFVLSSFNYVIDSRDDYGIIKNTNFRFLVSKDQTKIAFIDISHEIDYLHNLIWNSFGIGALSLLTFLLISFFLSGEIIKPVEKSWKQQQNFIADVSHELKTPLTVILANSSMLNTSNNLQENEQKWLKYINSEAKQMQNLIESLLLLASFDNNKQDFVMNKMDLSDTLLACTLAFEPVAFENGRLLTSNITPNVTINGNENNIKQLVMILLDNACKYSDYNSTISISLYKENRKAILKVHNKGSIIPKDEIENIFSRFYKIDKARTRNSDSYGLGLSIAKEIVGSHHGSIHVSSDEANGTTFTVYFNA